MRWLAIVAFVLLTPVVLFQLWDYIEARRLSDAVEAIRTKGEQTSMARTGRPATPEEKAASRYYGAAAVLTSDAYGDAFRRANHIIDELFQLDRDAAARDARLTELRAVEDAYAPALDLIDRAAVLDARGLEYAHQPRYGLSERMIANVNDLRIARLAFAGEADAASRALLSTLRLRRVFHDATYLTVRTDTNRTLRLILAFAPPDARTLSELQTERARWDVDSGAEAALVALRARVIEGVWPAASGPSPTLPRISDGRDGAPLLLRPYFTRQITRMLSQFDEALDAARRPLPSRLDAADALRQKYPVPRRLPGDDASARGGWLGSLGMGVFLAVPNMPAAEAARLIPQAAADSAERRVAIATLAVERYRREHAGATPRSLDDLAPGYLDAVPLDPFDGQKLRYLRTGGKFSVYSIGLNRRDDGGDWSGQPDTDRPLTTPQPRDIGLEIPIR